MVSLRFNGTGPAEFADANKVPVGTADIANNPAAELTDCLMNFRLLAFAFVIVLIPVLGVVDIHVRCTRSSQSRHTLHYQRNPGNTHRQRPR